MEQGYRATGALRINGDANPPSYLQSWGCCGHWYPRASAGGLRAEAGQVTSSQLRWQCRNCTHLLRSHAASRPCPMSSRWFLKAIQTFNCRDGTRWCNGRSRTGRVFRVDTPAGTFCVDQRALRSIHEPHELQRTVFNYWGAPVVWLHVSQHRHFSASYRLEGLLDSYWGYGHPSCSQQHALTVGCGEKTDTAAMC
jgi:hypothetical protein